jgi:GTPase
MKPVVVLVGRPNVGKSTLFNRLTRSRAALVADIPGLTRDRLYGDGLLGDRPYLLVDTGGIVTGLHALRRVNREQELVLQMSAQTHQALIEADAIIMLVDGQEGLTHGDRQLASDLRKLNKPLWLAVNKTEGIDPDVSVADFHSLGLGEPLAISSAHGGGIDTLMQHVLAALPKISQPEPFAECPRIAVVGRPNAGKSTLVNALLGEERVVVCDQPGTTRDSIRITLERDGKNYVLIDTAGVRRRARTEGVIEKYSIIKTLQAIEEANVVILVFDGTAGIGEHDVKLVGYVLERGRAVVIAVNKWDALDNTARNWAKRELTRKLAFLEFAPIHYISAKYRRGIDSLFSSVDAVFDSAMKVLSSPRLNRVLQQAVQAVPPPLVRGRRIRLKYAHQGGKNPPLVVVHGTQVEGLPMSYLRYLSKVFRESFGLSGSPVRIECRQGRNPFRASKARTRGQSARKKTYRRSRK